MYFIFVLSMPNKLLDIWIDLILYALVLGLLIPLIDCLDFVYIYIIVICLCLYL